MEEKYLNTLLELLGIAGVDKYDELLCDPQYGYVPEREQLRTKQQRTQAGHWQYFFLRSDLHLDRLTEEEQARLMSDEDPRQLVLDTLLKVVRVIPQTPDATEVFISLTGEKAINGSVVLGIAMSMAYDEQGNVIDWDAERKKRVMLQKLAELVQPAMTEVLGIPFTVLTY